VLYEKYCKARIPAPQCLCLITSKANKSAFFTYLVLFWQPEVEA